MVTVIQSACINAITFGAFPTRGDLIEQPSVIPASVTGVIHLRARSQPGRWGDGARVLGRAPDRPASGAASASAPWRAQRAQHRFRRRQAVSRRRRESEGEPSRRARSGCAPSDLGNSEGSVTVALSRMVLSGFCSVRAHSRAAASKSCPTSRRRSSSHRISTGPRPINAPNRRRAIVIRFRFLADATCSSLGRRGSAYDQCADDEGRKLVSVRLPAEDVIAQTSRGVAFGHRLMLSLGWCSKLVA